MDSFVEGNDSSELSLLVTLGSIFFNETLPENSTGFDPSFNESEGEDGGPPHGGGDSLGNVTLSGARRHPELSHGEDIAWVLTTSFVIFTMQTGISLIEAGYVSAKNEAHVMLKNAFHVVLGGAVYWLVGYGLSFGSSGASNPVIGWGDFATDFQGTHHGVFASFFFLHSAFAVIAISIPSGAVSERSTLWSQMILASVNVVVYAISAGWIWGSHGFLYRLGVVDNAGSCAVHLSGGIYALVGAYLVGPKLGRYDDGGSERAMGSPTTSLLGMFMMWWGWLAFNSGSSFGIRGGKWVLASRAAVVTLQASIGGGLVGFFLSWLRNRPHFGIQEIITSIVGALVSVNGGCFVYNTLDALLVGCIGSLLSVAAIPLLNWLHIDDTVAAVGTHGLGGLWGTLAVGIFAGHDRFAGANRGRTGLLKGGDASLLGIQAIASACVILWAFSTNVILIKVLDWTGVKIRSSILAELVGFDLHYHGERHKGVGVSRAASAFDLNTVDDDPGRKEPDSHHQSVLNRLRISKFRPAVSVRRILSGAASAFASLLSGQPGPSNTIHPSEEQGHVKVTAEMTENNYPRMDWLKPDDYRR